MLWFSWKIMRGVRCWRAGPDHSIRKEAVIVMFMNFQRKHTHIFFWHFRSFACIELMKTPLAVLVWFICFVCCSSLNMIQQVCTHYMSVGYGSALFCAKPYFCVVKASLCVLNNIIILFFKTSLTVTIDFCFISFDWWKAGSSQFARRLCSRWFPICQ